MTKHGRTRLMISWPTGSSRQLQNDTLKDRRAVQSNRSTARKATDGVKPSVAA